MRHAMREIPSVLEGAEEKRTEKKAEDIKGGGRKRKAKKGTGGDKVEPGSCQSVENRDNRTETTRL